MAAQPNRAGQAPVATARPARWARVVLNLAVVAGSGLVAGSATIHFYLWDNEGFRSVPTIGALFLAQAVTGWLLAAATVAWRHALLVLASAGYAIVSACALAYSVRFGLFGWHEVMRAPYVGMALAVELAAAAVLLAAAGALAARWWRCRRPAAEV